MFEKVNMYHPDKIADRIAGAIVDYAYQSQNNPKMAVEVLIGHGHCSIIVEGSVAIPLETARQIVNRISQHDVTTLLKNIPQDAHLAENQENGIRCGDNGIFKGVPVSLEEQMLTSIAKDITSKHPYDGKYIIDYSQSRYIVCQSNINSAEVAGEIGASDLNPIGDWTGGIDVDTGATNRKLGSDMGQSVTGGGLHGKDLSKADVSVNIYVWLKAQETKQTVELCCAIGDTTIDDKPYSEIVEIARKYIQSIGGFEKFAEWGLLR
jgi:S-adenosylmethionine synthetase